MFYFYILSKDKSYQLIMIFAILLQILAREKHCTCVSHGKVRENENFEIMIATFYSNTQASVFICCVNY